MGSTQLSNQQQAQKTNPLSLVGLVLAFFTPVMGLIISIIALKKIKKTNENGRRLALAGIIVSTLQLVIFTAFVIIFIVVSIATAALQKNDNQTRSDIDEIYSALQEYYSINDAYPEEVNIQTLTEIDPDILIDPNGKTINDGEYRYTGTECDSGRCWSYSLSGDLENISTPYTRPPPFYQ